MPINHNIDAIKASIKECNDKVATRLQVSDFNQHHGNLVIKVEQNFKQTTLLKDYQKNAKEVQKSIERAKNDNDKLIK